MHSLKIILLLLVLHFSGISSVAQYSNLSFDRVSANYGLPNGYIKSIMEDSFGFLWFGTREGIFRYDGYEFKAYRHDFADSTTLSHPNINDIHEDKENVIWVATNSGLSALDRRTGKFERFMPFTRAEAKSKSYNLIRGIFEDSQGRLWLAARRNMTLFDRQTKTFQVLNEQDDPEVRHFVRSYYEDDAGNIWAGTSRGLLKLSRGDTTFQHIPLSADLKHGYNRNIVAICDDQKGKFWLATRGGLIRWDPESKEIEDHFLPAGVQEVAINFLTLDSKGNLWFALNRNGLGVYDIEKGEFHHFKFEANQDNSLNSNTVTNILEDQFENIWVGTENGISKIRMDDSGFKFLQNEKVDGNIGNNILRVLKDSQGRIWTKTPEGIFLKPSDQAQSVKVDYLPKNIRGISYDWFLEDKDGGVWLSISGGGVFKVPPGEERFRKLSLGDTLDRTNIFRIINDKNHDDILWIGTSLGLCRLNRNTLERQWYLPKNDLPEIASNQVAIFDQYNEREIFLYYSFSGSIGKFDIQTGKYERFYPRVEDKIALEGDIKDIVVSDDGNIWIANLYGLTNFNIHNKTFKILGKKEGLLEHELQAVTLDKQDRLWVSGYRFFASYDRQEEVFENYPAPKELRHFQSKSRHVAPDGSILWGSINGVYMFHPDRINRNQVVPKVVLTNFRVKTESYPLEEAYEKTERIKLFHEENDITFEFSGIHFIDPSANEYKCKLIGYDDEWRDLGNEHKISYTNLNPGNYTFQAIAANADGVWNEEGLVVSLAILPPFWQTLWFEVLVILLLVSIFYAVYKNIQHQSALRRQKELALRAAEYKTQFLADVSHEIRTPMNAIIGLSKLILGTSLDTKQHKFVNAIQQSSKNLLNIINDLLDHTKLEAGKFTFTKKQFNIKELVDQLTNTFEAAFLTKQITFDIRLAPECTLPIIGDPLRLNQILTNLLGNALKFTQEGKVWLNVAYVDGSDEQVTFRFEVGDTGIGIEKEQVHAIFDHYQQTNNNSDTQQKGTGLGLSIAKQLVEKQNGQLSIESVVNKGTTLCFDLTFEKAQARYKKEQTEGSMTPLNALKVLLVEDTYFNQMLVTEILKKYIKVIDIKVAENGKQAIDHLRADHFDLVLMDVKMPVMDGYEATRRIRKGDGILDAKIPILAVTASAMPEQLAKCKAAGMDDYITKPIDEKELINKIKSLTTKITHD